LDKKGLDLPVIGITATGNLVKPQSAGGDRGEADGILYRDGGVVVIKGNILRSIPVLDIAAGHGSVILMENNAIDGYRISPAIFNPSIG
jgi:hypothetical protein